MTPSPYQPDDLAMCRHLVTHAQNLMELEPEDRADILRSAYDILRKDRAFRLGQSRISGRPRLKVIPRGDGPGTSGDAA